MEAKEGLGAEEPRLASPVAVEEKGEEKKPGLLGKLAAAAAKIKPSKTKAKTIKKQKQKQQQHKQSGDPQAIATQMQGTSLGNKATQQPVAEPKRGGRRRKTRSNGKRRKTRRGGKSIRRRSRRRSRRRRGTSYKIR